MLARNRKFEDSPLEGTGFELAVPGQSPAAIGEAGSSTQKKRSPQVQRFTRHLTVPNSVMSEVTLESLWRTGRIGERHVGVRSK